MKTSKLNLGNKDDWEPEVEGMDRQPTGNAGLSLETSFPVERRESQRRRGRVIRSEEQFRYEQRSECC